MSTVTPEVLWAQRSSASEAEKNIIYLTINAPDVTPESLKLELTPTQLIFAGSTKNKNYAVTLEFYAEIDVENSTKHVSSRAIEYKLRKKEAKEEFWPRLLKESKKVGYVKTDFDKWVDEDEQEENEEDPMAGAGMPEMGGMGGMGGMDFQSMMANMGGGAGGMDFSSLGGMGGMGEDDEADEEIPELEGDSTSASKPSGTDAAAADAAKAEDKA
ncbi:HSP20-like chaperone [Ascodesmis nigricans]|uniref:HSP20-like chaperone n=1 Tax=Ascodesmis nigricans TaxID=341454 RepID=A0A4S2N5Q8_9PEZI|nr:HSP20-like chaperone [Ascodesmis nigricans]